jgi:hypothetical protein
MAVKTPIKSFITLTQGGKHKYLSNFCSILTLEKVGLKGTGGW